MSAAPDARPAGESTLRDSPAPAALRIAVHLALVGVIALGITLPTTIDTPLAGLLLIEDWGGLRNAARAYDAYLCFWLMAAISLWPDLIRLATETHADEPTHGMQGGLVRSMFALALTIYIVLVMATKAAWITGR